MLPSLASKPELRFFLSYFTKQLYIDHCVCASGANCTSQKGCITVTAIKLNLSFTHMNFI